jgi:hypothetical protein
MIDERKMLRQGRESSRKRNSRPGRGGSRVYVVGGDRAGQCRATCRNNMSDHFEETVNALGLISVSLLETHPVGTTPKLQAQVNVKVRDESIHCLLS